MTTRALIGIGSNLDDPAGQVRSATQALSEIRDSVLMQVSRLYRNPPMGPIDQPDYVNAVAAIDTRLDAQTLLSELQCIEAAAGRQRDGTRWGPRPLDLDLLIFGEAVINTKSLTVPHPGIPVRAFVLYPLAEIAPDTMVPGMGAVQELLAAVSDDALEVVD